MDWLDREYPRISAWFGLARKRRRPLKLVFYLVLHLLGFLFSISAVRDTRTPQGAVAWVLSLNTIPLVALPAYWVFGGSEMKDYLETRSVGLAELRPAARRYLGDIETVTPEELSGNHLLTTLGRISSLPVTKNNRAELLVDGKGTFRSIFSAIDNAEHYIFVQFYIIRSDGLGIDMKRRLIKKAREGVRVFVLYDDYGSMDLGDDFTTDLREAGAKVSPFMNLGKNINRYQLNYRNHRKLVVVDGKTAFVGGNNVGDEYLGMHPQLTPWRDSHLRITGPIVSCLQVPFVEDWKWATGETIGNLEWNLKKVDQETRGKSQAVCIASGPADKMETCSLFFHAAIHAAEKRIWIATPYFVPDQSLVTALQLAAKRGVEVRILIPDKNDNFLVENSADSYIEELDLEGIELYKYTEGFSHQKVLIVDDDFSAIGSANFDNRSLRLNFELTVAVLDKEFQVEVVSMLTKDFSNSRLVTIKEWNSKSEWAKLTSRVCRLLAPIQ